MHKERLIKLAEFLERVPDSKTFDLGTWFTAEHGPVCFLDKDALKGNVTREDMHTCGTTACAMGWAVTIPEFREAGLQNQWGMPMFHGRHGYDAAALFFGITYEQSMHLFDPFRYRMAELRDPLAVARRLRELAGAAE